MIEVISIWYSVKKYSLCRGIDLMWLINEVLGDMLEFFFWLFGFGICGGFVWCFLGLVVCCFDVVCGGSC